ncbi:MAG: hypothetical protein COT74_06700 [Bdellovibrionales bacterium CG10_big_fil_rev_8_21_14_0_10_45_34]|nr:MAG: hypothetical protein COT74_06700 [Bdellovibrionales bacterium CG10_big_fil_rev_8_21_14_0_10_45_34]
MLRAFNVIFIGLILSTPTLRAQSSVDQVLDELESYPEETYGGDVDSSGSQAEDSTSSDVSSSSPSVDEAVEAQNPAESNAQVYEKPSDLTKLSAYSDIAVIQRRFLPKTNRFEFFPSLGIVLNQAFFLSSMFAGRMAYSFTEYWAVEVTGSYMGSTERQITTDLKEKRGVLTNALVTPTSYYGADVKWSPIYGKLGVSNRSIVPFDMYFSLGMGMTQTNQPDPALTFHGGTGQIFALSKSMALRWDLGWYWYQAKARGASAESSFIDMHLNLGVSFFFPGAKYR